MDANDFATKNAGIVGEYLDLNAQFKGLGMDLRVESWVKPSKKGHSHSFVLDLGDKTSSYSGGRRIMSIRTMAEARKFLEGLKHNIAATKDSQAKAKAPMCGAARGDKGLLPIDPEGISIGVGI